MPYYFVPSKAKLDDRFSNSQFIFDQYEIRKRRDRNKNGEGLLEYISKSLESTSIFNSDIRRPEIMIKNIKWAIFSVVITPSNSNVNVFFDKFTNTLAKIKVLLS